MPTECLCFSRCMQHMAKAYQIIFPHIVPLLSREPPLWNSGWGLEQSACRVFGRGFPLTRLPYQPILWSLVCGLECRSTGVMVRNWREGFESHEGRTNIVTRGPFVENIRYDGFHYSNHPILHHSVSVKEPWPAGPSSMATPREGGFLRRNKGVSMSIRPSPVLLFTDSRSKAWSGYKGIASHCCHY